MKRFIIEVSDSVTKEDIEYSMYDGNGSLGERSFRYDIQETSEASKFANGDRRMTNRQLKKLWGLCGGYNVPFREDDYHFSQFMPTSQVMVEGWLGGKPGTLYVGVEENGDSHS